MLTNPKDYINYYVDILRREYKLNDLKINYHGFVGFLMNLFAWTNNDIKQYYDYLFKEGFLATAEENKNLYLHASKYGYNVGFATPGFAFGNFIFDFLNLPPRTSNIYKREVVLDTPLKVVIGGFEFQTESQYRFVEEGNPTKYYCIVDNPTDRQRMILSATSVLKVPMYNLKQYSLKKYEQIVSNYDYGVYYQYNFTVNPEDHLVDIDIRVKKSGTTQFDRYNISRVKAFDNSISKSVYLNQVSEKLFVVELGNGYHGEWVPNSQIEVNVYTAKGEITNSLTKQLGNITGNFNIVNYSQNLDVISSHRHPFTNTNFTIDFHGVEGATNARTDSDLKNDIVKWVQTRESLINRNDFFNTFSRYIKDFDVVFKKSYFIDNNFYLCRNLRDQYKNILYTTNHTYKCIKYDDPDLIKNLKAKVLDEFTGSNLPIGRAYYKIVAVDKFYEAIPSETITATVTGIKKAISLTWDVVEGAEYYKIFGRDREYNKYWIIDKNHKDIDGQMYFIDVDQPSHSGNIYSRHKVIDQVSFPEFDIDLSETFNISESFYNWKLYKSDDTSITYYITNKTFWFTPESITRTKGGQEKVLHKVLTPRLDQLISNSWVIVNKLLYIKLEKPFSESSDILHIHYDKKVDLISPFVYQYNKFFDWFEGYFVFDNIVRYPIVQYSTDKEQPGQSNVPISHINIFYDKRNIRTTVSLKSYQSLNPDYVFKMKIEGVDVEYDEIFYSNETGFFSKYYDGFFDNEIKINLECYLEDELQFYLTTDYFRQAYKIDDQLVLVKYYSEDENYYVCNIPLLSFERPTSDELEYENQDYVMSQIFDFVANSNIRQNRIQSDSVQTRFLNTTFCDSYFGKKILLQKYDHNLILPLNIEINIKYKTSNFDVSKNYRDIELLVAEYLQNEASGLNIKFYNSQIIDLIHDYSEEIISVSVNVYDSYGTPLNNGIEVRPTENILPDIDVKLKMLEFTSVYWWWNLNNIIITQTV